LCYYGKGGFIWNDVYNLPIHLRRFYITQIKSAMESKNKAEEQAISKQKASVPKFSKPSPPKR
jgi:hypothetical protein